MSTMMGFFMMFDFPFEIQRSLLDATFKDSDELRDFAEIFMEFDDDKKVIAMETQLNDDEMKASGLFDP
jgi:hypothetical protein